MAARDARWHCERWFSLSLLRGAAEMFFIDTSPGVLDYRAAPWAVNPGACVQTLKLDVAAIRSGQSWHAVRGCSSCSCMQTAAPAPLARSTVPLRRQALLQLSRAHARVAVTEAPHSQAVKRRMGALCKAPRTACALAGGISSQSWEAQLLELEARLAASSAPMKLVVGHHPVRSRRQARPLATSPACACRLSLESCLKWSGDMWVVS